MVWLTVASFSLPKEDHKNFQSCHKLQQTNLVPIGPSLLLQGAEEVVCPERFGCFHRFRTMAYLCDFSLEGRQVLLERVKQKAEPK